MQSGEQNRTKLIAGAVLMALALFLVVRSFWPSGQGSEPPRTTSSARTSPSPVQGGAPTAAPPARTRGTQSPRVRRYTPATNGQVDPTLRLDLLAKVAGVTYTGSERNIFQYHTAPPPPPPKPVVDPVEAAKKAGPAPPPPPPPIPLKYYGYAHRPSETRKKAFLVEGEEIFIAGEGEVVNKRYRIVRIGVNTIEIEDLVTKHKQTVPLQES